MLLLRHGIIPGVDEGDDFKVQYRHQSPQSHWYASNAEAYRAFAELGEVWVTIGKARPARILFMMLCASVCAAPTLNAAGQSRVTLSLR